MVHGKILYWTSEYMQFIFKNNAQFTKNVITPCAVPNTKSLDSHRYQTAFDTAPQYNILKFYRLYKKEPEFQCVSVWGATMTNRSKNKK